MKDRRFHTADHACSHATAREHAERSGLSLRSCAGFTLMEVLVATAITGIALGVLLSGFAQGHRQAFRGDMYRKAAGAAEVVLHMLNSEGNGFPESDSGEIDGYEGWTYRVESRELVLDISEPGGMAEEDGQEGAEEESGIEVPELMEVSLSIIPPDGYHPFVLVLWENAGQQ